MINIECNPENQEQVLKAIEQALKGVDANITVMDEEITELDVMQFMSYNIKQQRVYLGRIEGRAREIRGELKDMKEMLEPFSLLAEMILSNVDEEDLTFKAKMFLQKKERGKRDEIPASTHSFSREDLSKLP